MTTQTVGQCAQNQAIDAETRFVTIPACSNHSGLLTFTVKLHWTCPECGGPRGETFRTQSYDGALPVQCNGWNNPCGHIDHYQNVRLESQTNGLNENTQNAAVDTPHAEPTNSTSEHKDDAETRYLERIYVQEIERETVLSSGIPALLRLTKIADRDTGQACTVRRFLLGLYNGYRFPFNLIKLRSLDKSLFDDCMAVLTLDARVTAKEVHLYIDNGGKRFERWAKMAGGAQ